MPHEGKGAACCCVPAAAAAPGEKPNAQRVWRLPPPPRATPPAGGVTSPSAPAPDWAALARKMQQDAEAAVALAGSTGASPADGDVNAPTDTQTAGTRLSVSHQAGGANSPARRSPAPSALLVANALASGEGWRVRGACGACWRRLPSCCACSPTSSRARACHAAQVSVVVGHELVEVPDAEKGAFVDGESYVVLYEFPGPGERAWGRSGAPPPWGCRRALLPGQGAVLMGHRRACACAAPSLPSPRRRYAAASHLLLAGERGAASRAGVWRWWRSQYS